jgi:hypothetical protein
MMLILKVPIHLADMSMLQSCMNLDLAPELSLHVLSIHMNLRYHLQSHYCSTVLLFGAIYYSKFTPTQLFQNLKICNSPGFHLNIYKQL